MTQLNNPLAQIGINDFNPMTFQERIQVALFRQHRFAFDNLCGTVLFQDVKDDLVVFCGCASPVHYGSQSGRVAFKLFEVIAQS